MFFILSKTLDVLLSPFSWGLALLGAAIPWTSSYAQVWRRRRRLGVLGLAILMVASCEPVSNALQWRVDHAAPTTFRADATYDVVVLLGGVTDERVGASTGEVAYNESVERLLRTYDLLRQGNARYAIVSAAAPAPPLDAFGEARALADQLVKWGIDPSRVLVEAQARNTRENAVYSKRIIDERGFKNIVVVTSAFHMKRSLECFAAVGLNVDALAVDFRAYNEGATYTALLPRPSALAQTTMALRELFGRVVYRSRGYGRALP